MKTFGLYAFIISLASVAAAVQPSHEPAEAHAASAVAGFTVASICESATCMNGWQAAGHPPGR